MQHCRLVDYRTIDSLCCKVKACVSLSATQINITIGKYTAGKIERICREQIGNTHLSCWRESIVYGRIANELVRKSQRLKTEWHEEVTSLNVMILVEVVFHEHITERDFFFLETNLNFVVPLLEELARNTKAGVIYSDGIVRMVGIICTIEIRTSVQVCTTDEFQRKLVVLWHYCNLRL